MKKSNLVNIIGTATLVAGIGLVPQMGISKEVSALPFESEYKRIEYCTTHVDLEQFSYLELRKRIENCNDFKEVYGFQTLMSDESGDLWVKFYYDTNGNHTGTLKTHPLFGTGFVPSKEIRDEGYEGGEIQYNESDGGILFATIPKDYTNTGKSEVFVVPDLTGNGLEEVRNYERTILRQFGKEINEGIERYNSK